MTTLPVAQQQYTLWGDKWEFIEGRYSLSGINRLASFKNSMGLQRALARSPTTRVPLGCSLHIFKQGILPVYDHPRNASGGHFKLQAVNVKVADETWMQFAEALVSGGFPRDDDVNGITYMKKQHIRGIKVWIANSLDKELVAEVKAFLQAQLPPQQFINFKFCPHKYILQTLLKQSKGLVNSGTGRRQRGMQRDESEYYTIPPEMPMDDEQSEYYAESSIADEAVLAEPHSGSSAPLVESSRSSNSHSDSESIGEISDMPSHVVSPSSSTANLADRSESDLFADFPMYHYAQGSPYEGFPVPPPTPVATAPDTSAPPLQPRAHKMTPLARLHHKLNQHGPYCPLPDAPVFYMQQLLVYYSQYDWDYE